MIDTADRRSARVREPQLRHSNCRERPRCMRRLNYGHSHRHGTREPPRPRHRLLAPLTQAPTEGQPPHPPTAGLTAAMASHRVPNSPQPAQRRRTQPRPSQTPDRPAVQSTTWYPWLAAAFPPCSCSRSPAPSPPATSATDSPTSKSHHDCNRRHPHSGANQTVLRLPSRVTFRTPATGQIQYYYETQTQYPCGCH